MTSTASPPSIAGPQFGSPALITGVPRSGTSLVTGLLAACGLWLGKTVPGDDDNPRGFFENVVLREKLQKHILGLGRFDPSGVRHLPPSTWRPAIGKFREAVSLALTAQGYEGRETWGFKDAKMTLTWRIWDQNFPAARWIVVRRPSEQIVSSCLRTGFMRQHSSDPAFWQRFVSAYLERLADLQRTVAWFRVIESADIIAGRFEGCEQLVGELDLTWRPDAVRAFVVPEHWRHMPQSPA